MIDVFAGRQWRDRSIGKEVKVEPQENLKGMLWARCLLKSFLSAERNLFCWSRFVHPPVIIYTERAKIDDMLFKDQFILKTLMKTRSESATWIIAFNWYLSRLNKSVMGESKKRKFWESSRPESCAKKSHFWLLICNFFVWTHQSVKWVSEFWTNVL